MTDPPPDANTRLAVQRTRLAHERTLMAWIRTATSLISPQIVGLAMILIGLIALVLAWIQHRRDITALQAEYGAMPFSIAGLIAALIAGLGAIALIGVTLRF